MQPQQPVGMQEQARPAVPNGGSSSPSSVEMTEFGGVAGVGLGADPSSPQKLPVVPVSDGGAGDLKHAVYSAPTIASSQSLSATDPDPNMPLTGWQLKFWRTTYVRERWAWCMYDWSNSVYSNTVIAAFLPGMFAILFSASFFSLMVSMSVLAQVVVFISVSAFGDYGNLRKKLLIAASGIGSVCCCLFLVVDGPSHQALAGVLLIVSNVCYGASFVFYNGFLNVLVRKHEDLQPLTNNAAAYTAKKCDLEDHESNRGYMYGYVGGLSMTIINFAVAFSMAADENETDSVKEEASVRSARINIFLAGLWWMGFALITFVWVGNNPGKPKPANKSYPAIALEEIYAAMKILKGGKYRNLRNFLVAFFCFSDGYSAISSLGVLFGTQELGMAIVAVAILLLEVQICAFIGCKFFEWLRNRYAGVVAGDSRSMDERSIEEQAQHADANKKVIFINLVIMALLPVWGILGLVPGSPIGIKTEVEFFIFGAIYGLNIGSVQAFSRSLYGLLIPVGYEVEFYGLFAITDKGSSWISPLIASVVLTSTKKACGWKDSSGTYFEIDAKARCIVDGGHELCSSQFPVVVVDSLDDIAGATVAVCYDGGSIRLAFIVITILICISLPLLHFGVHSLQGMKEAKVDNDRTPHPTATPKELQTDTNSIPSATYNTQANQ